MDSVRDDSSDRAGRADHKKISDGSRSRRSHFGRRFRFGIASGRVLPPKGQGSGYEQEAKVSAGRVGTARRSTIAEPRTRGARASRTTRAHRSRRVLVGPSDFPDGSQARVRAIPAKSARSPRRLSRSGPISWTSGRYGRRSFHESPGTHALVGDAQARLESKYIGVESERIDRRSIHPTDFDRDD